MLVGEIPNLNPVRRSLMTKNQLKVVIPAFLIVLAVGILASFAYDQRHAAPPTPAPAQAPTTK